MRRTQKSLVVWACAWLCYGLVMLGIFAVIQLQPRTYVQGLFFADGWVANLLRFLFILLGAAAVVFQLWRWAKRRGISMRDEVVALLFLGAMALTAVFLITLESTTYLIVVTVLSARGAS
jgi:hypothetical protein